MINKPKTSEYHEFYAGYIALVKNEDIINYLDKQGRDMVQAFENIDSTKVNYAYAEGKWTVKQLLRHMIDTERVLAFRILAVSRNDQNSLPGFDEGDYVSQSNDDENSFGDLIQEFNFLRLANLSMIKNLPKTTYENIGTVNGSPTSTRALVYILAGHNAHHLNILQELYLS